MPRTRLRVVRMLLIVSGLYLVCLVFISLAQRRMMYFPCKTPVRELEADAAKEGFKPWRNAQGEAIGWHRASAQGPSRRGVLVIHGNAGCAGDRFHYADAFQSIEPMDFYILEYPGYGGRAGAPSQSTILNAAEDGLKSIPGEYPVFLMAESLGTGVASFLAGAHPDRVGGVLLIAPYNNMTAVAQKHMPLFPVRAILRDKYPSSEWLSKYRGPVAVLLAGRDTIIPTELGRDLYDRYAGPKKLWIEPDLGHNDLHMPRAGTWQEVIEFWNSTASERR
jgi:pimeloyl-ACP methyl ester carboxylesterase